MRWARARSREELQGQFDARVKHATRRLILVKTDRTSPG